MSKPANHSQEKRKTFSPADESRAATSLDFSLLRDEWGQLTFQRSVGETPVPVWGAPLFPISHPDQWIAVCSADGTELACVVDPARLPSHVWKLLKEDLDRREFVPIIQRIVWVSGNSEPCELKVQTDRGPTTFVLKSEDDIRRIGDHQILIIDAHKTRYFIPDLRNVDAKTRRIVEWYV